MTAAFSLFGFAISSKKMQNYNFCLHVFHIATSVLPIATAVLPQHYAFHTL